MPQGLSKNMVEAHRNFYYPTVVPDEAVAPVTGTLVRTLVPGGTFIGPGLYLAPDKTVLVMPYLPSLEALADRGAPIDNIWAPLREWAADMKWAIYTWRQPIEMTVLAQRGPCRVDLR